MKTEAKAPGPGVGAHRLLRRSALAGIGAYTACLCLVLAVLAWHPTALPWLMRFTGLVQWGHDPALEAAVAATLHEAETIPDGAVLLLGDSIVAWMDKGDVAPDAHNLAVPSLSTVTLLPMVPRVAALGQARAVVLGIGGNDLGFRAPAEIVADYAAIIAAIPARVALVVLAVLPMDQQDPWVRAHPQLGTAHIDALNLSIAAICARRAGCELVLARPFLADAAGNLRAGLHVGDGRHLSAAGYRLLTEAVRAALARALAHLPIRERT